MALVSRLFRGVRELEACLELDSAHITNGTVGPHIPRIQKALMMLDGVVVDSNEVEEARYGPATAAAVLAYKRKRSIINRSYQTQADNIVGKMTIQSLDRETLAAEGPISGSPCGDPVKGQSSSLTRGNANRIADVPVNLGARLKVSYQTAVGTGKRFAEGLKATGMRFALETQATALLAPWGMTLQPTNLGSFAFPFTVNPAARVDVQKIREFAEKAAATGPNVLRVIFCRFDDSAGEFGVSGGPLFGGQGFLEFVLLNVLKLRPDAGTMMHEMIHCSNRDLFHDSAHDKDGEFPASVFCSQNGRTEIRKPHALTLAGSFFAR